MSLGVYGAPAAATAGSTTPATPTTATASASTASTATAPTATAASTTTAATASTAAPTPAGLAAFVRVLAFPFPFALALALTTLALLGWEHLSDQLRVRQSNESCSAYTLEDAFEKRASTRIDLVENRCQFIV